MDSRPCCSALRSFYLSLERGLEGVIHLRAFESLDNQCPCSTLATTSLYPKGSRPRSPFSRLIFLDEASRGWMCKLTLPKSGSAPL